MMPRYINKRMKKLLYVFYENGAMARLNFKMVVFNSKDNTLVTYVFFISLAQFAYNGTAVNIYIFKKI